MFDLTEEDFQLRREENGLTGFDLQIDDGLDWSIGSLDMEGLPFCSIIEQFDVSQDEEPSPPFKKVKVDGIKDDVCKSLSDSLSDGTEKSPNTSENKGTSLAKIPSIINLNLCNTLLWNSRNTCDRLMSLNPIVPRESPKTLSEELTVQITLAENRLISEHLRPYLIQSALSQEALHQWDKQHGLPASHARTMLRSKRTRSQLLEGLL